MARAGTTVFLCAMAVLCRTTLPFVLVHSGAPRLGWAQQSGRQLVSASKTKVAVCPTPMMAAGSPDECKGVGPTPGWHRVAHNNQARIRIGDRLPAVEVRRLEGDGGVETFSLRELFGDKKGVLVGVPGAFTPTCSKVHLPEFVGKASRLAAKGAELVAFVAVNDVFVMRAWEEAQGAAGKVLMLSDGNGDLAASLGMMVDLSAQGMGLRCKRFMCLVENGRVSHLTVDEGEGARGVCASTAERALEEAGSRVNGRTLQSELEREAEARAGAAAAAAAVATASATRETGAGEVEPLAV